MMGVAAVVLFLACATHLNANPNPNPENTAELSATEFSDAVILRRLNSLDLPFTVRITPEVRMYLRRYLVEGANEAETILGRSSLYFPVFEHYLRLYNLPDALKYLPIIESALQPRVTSAAGAAGLWQFVPSTAQQYGLVINGSIDERLDVYQATEAAVRMLAALYAQFNDWGLVLAAYNGGPGRVRQALRSVRCADYWQAQDHLPRESQKYVPAFIAAAYLVNFHSMHGLTPNFPSYEMQETRTFRVFNTVSLAAVARTIGISHQTLRALNPGYLSGVIPRSQDGNYIVVPMSAAGAFQQNYGPATTAQSAPQGRIRSSYVVVAGDRIETLALLFRCSVEDIMRWNGLQKAEVVVKQHLVVYLPRENVRP